MPCNPRYLEQCRPWLPNNRRQLLPILSTSRATCPHPGLLPIGGAPELHAPAPEGLCLWVPHQILKGFNSPGGKTLTCWIWHLTSPFLSRHGMGNSPTPQQPSAFMPLKHPERAVPWYYNSETLRQNKLVHSIPIDWFVKLYLRGLSVHQHQALGDQLLKSQLTMHEVLAAPVVQAVGGLLLIRGPHLHHHQCTMHTSMVHQQAAPGRHCCTSSSNPGPQRLGLGSAATASVSDRWIWSKLWNINGKIWPPDFPPIFNTYFYLGILFFGKWEHPNLG